MKHILIYSQSVAVDGVVPEEGESISLKNVTATFHKIRGEGIIELRIDSVNGVELPTPPGDHYDYDKEMEEEDIVRQAVEYDQSKGYL